jgi:hypothetical protein
MERDKVGIIRNPGGDSANGPAGKNIDHPMGILNLDRMLRHEAAKLLVALKMPRAWDL